MASRPANPSSASLANAENPTGSLTSSPGLGRGLVASLLAHGVRLPLVLRHAGVHLLDNIGADGAGEDLGHGVRLAAGAAALADDADGRPRGHRFGIRRNLLGMTVRPVAWDKRFFVLRKLQLGRTGPGRLGGALDVLFQVERWLEVVVVWGIVDLPVSGLRLEISECGFSREFPVGRP